MLRTQGGMMDMAGLTNILAGAGAITQGAGHRISLEGEAGDGQGQAMEVSVWITFSDAEFIDQTENTPLES